MAGAAKKPPSLFELLGGAFDPVVHRVGGDKLGLLHLVEHFELQTRMDVGKKDKGAGSIALGQTRPEILKDVEMRVDRVAVVQVEAVLALPAECFSGDPLQPGQIDTPAIEDRHLVAGEVLADDGHDPHVGEERRRDGEVGRGATDDTGRFAKRRLDRIERHGADG
jgi:hypothetical protein